MNASIEGHGVNVGGMTTRYFAAGAGPPLLLLHGDGDAPDDILHIATALAALGAYFASRRRDDVDARGVPSAR